MVVPEATTGSTVRVTTSERSGRSTSTTVSVPDSVRPALVSAIVSAALSPAPTLMSGASFEPVMVIVTVWSSKTPLSSLARTV